MDDLPALDIGLGVGDYIDAFKEGLKHDSEIFLL